MTMKNAGTPNSAPIAGTYNRALFSPAFSHLVPTASHITSRHATSLHATSRNITSCHVTSQHVKSRHNVADGQEEASRAYNVFDEMVEAHRVQGEAENPYIV